MKKSAIIKLTETLIKLQRSYASTFRVMITEERYRLVKSKIITDYTYDTDALREPLIEHVGHLPIIASYLHPHIEHKKDVDLGRVLTMLSVHDIGETVVGDVLTYAKVKSHTNLEAKVTKRLLPKYLYNYFEEMEEKKTFDAKFAKSVDSLAPLLHEMTLPTEVLLGRFQYHNFNVDKIIAKKEPHFAWDQTLKLVFSYLVKKYRKMEKG